MAVKQLKFIEIILPNITMWTIKANQLGIDWGKSIKKLNSYF